MRRDRCGSAASWRSPARCSPPRAAPASRSSSPATTRRRRRPFPVPPPTELLPPARPSRPATGSLPPPARRAGEQPATTPPATNATTTTTPLASLPDCPVDALDERDRAGRHHVLARTHRRQRGRDPAHHRRLQRQPDPRPRLVREPGRLPRDDRQVLPVDRRRPAGARDVPRLHDAAGDRLGRGDPDRRRASRPPASTRRTFQPSTIAAYSAAGVQWGMPFNVSNPVLYYNRNMFEAAGLDPDRPPQSLEELRQYSQQLVDSGAAAYGLAVESGSGSGGGWYLEQWFANMGELYADNGNGRLAPATRVLYDGPAGVAAADLRAVADQRRAGGLRRRQRRRRRPAAQARRLVGAGGDGARVVGVPRHRDQHARRRARSRTSAPRTSVSARCPARSRRRRRWSAAPRVYVTEGKCDARGGGGVGLHAVHGEPGGAGAVRDVTRATCRCATTRSRSNRRSSVYRDDPRYRVAYDQLVKTPDSPASLGPILGPQREIRSITANAVAEIFNGGDVQSALTERRRAVQRAARQLQRQQRDYRPVQRR